MINAKIRLLKVKDLFTLSFCLFLLISGLNGCSEDSTGISDGNGTPQAPRTNIPEQLVGSWTTGNISSVNFFNPNTGSWSSPSGVGMFYKLTQDGYYEKGVLLQSSLYGCTSTFFAYNRGTVTVEGNKIAFYPSYGRIKSEDNCVEGNNYEKSDELSPETLIWELGTDDFGNEALWLSYENGSPSAFHRN